MLNFFNGAAWSHEEFFFESQLRDIMIIILTPQYFFFFPWFFGHYSLSFYIADWFNYLGVLYIKSS